MRNSIDCIFRGWVGRLFVGPVLMNIQMANILKLKTLIFKL
jgi:hypothetical protein